jgi:EpsI family protein
MKKLIIILALVIPFGMMATILRYRVVEPALPSQLASIPLQVGQWQGEDVPIEEATAAVLQATEILLRGYQDPDGNYVGVFIAYFRDQKYGSQIHSPRHCLPGGGWVVADLQRVPFDLGVRKIDCNRMTITKKTRVDQMFYWFHTRSGDLTSEYALKLDLVKNSLLLSPTDAIILRLTVGQGRKSTAECQQVAEKFMQDALGEIRRALPFSSM